MGYASGLDWLLDMSSSQGGQIIGLQELLEWTYICEDGCSRLVKAFVFFIIIIVIILYKRSIK